MDWFNLNDPFTQQVPLKITNAYSGTLWFQGYLNNPRSGYYNYSGIQMGAVNSGASTTLVMTWDAGVSGWITGSSPITDTLTLNLTTFTSSNYTGSYSSGNFTVFNTLFNRYSGVIKVFGDIYNNDNPTPTASQGGVGTLTTNNYTYAVSYVLSGWESDVSAPSNSISPISGAVALSWTSIVGATAYYLWRWSGTADFTRYSGFGSTIPRTLSGTMDLVSIVTTNSDTDTGTQLRTGYYRNRFWSQSGGTNFDASDTDIYLSAPQSRNSFASNPWVPLTHTFYLNRNASGTSLLGPFYCVFHKRERTTGDGNVHGIAIATGADAFASGTVIADTDAVGGILSGVWMRHVIMLGSSGQLSASGIVHVQFIGGGNTVINLDDVFVVAQS